MNWLDIVILIILAVSTLVGLKTGVVKAVLSVIGVILGVILAGRYYNALAGSLTFITQPSLAKIAAFAIILIAVMVVATLISWVVKWAISALMLGWVNHLGGAVFGFILGAIFCGAILTMWAKFSGISTPVRDSALAGMLLNSFPIVLALLPKEFDSVRSFFK
jgi:membrane protein required for colicin V production